MRSYLTIARDGEATLEVKRSRFLCTLRRVEQESEARALVDELRRAHWDARHHCSAFVIGPDAMLQRSSDDGEPAGTAGAPMLEVLRGHGVSDVAVVVTRWFGGILLGAGGLVRAYGDAVSAGLAEVGTLERRLLEEWSVRLDHTEAGRVEAELRTRGVEVLDTAYAQDVRLLLGVTDPQALVATVAALTSGRVEPERVGERWVDGR
ncbi:YigZ family protein [Cellulomonas dongxiuzhuiae]|uniref:YigZ family protein n=1 Tax=Cellulomonas dongxiuzhuiae TaxID=2819979 RepID=A0ABX8GJ96_9CELL|nr:YigZ family protein [Cellulomonas dongxiuzhuiae]MBO3095144.1 YigZ family protein [Cellulomonas dongxiuzhuiae]QWC16149.1 YigZ family protein [Cellulomonas dongxiuzhuiae]